MLAYFGVFLEISTNTPPMNIEQFRDYCLGLKGTTEAFPFDNKTLVFKCMNKMYALLDVDNFNSLNLKCDPEKAVELREQYHAVTAGYHMNKKHWNTITINADLNDNMLLNLTSHSYELIVNGLTKTQKAELAQL